MSKSFLKRALENKDEQAKTVVLNGPLSDVFASALQAAYARPESSEENQLATESQEMEMQALKKLAAAIILPAPGQEGGAQVYGVSETEVTPQDIVNVTTDLAGRDSQPDEYVVILNGTGEDEQLQPEMVNLGVALETIVSSYGGRFYRSLEAYAKDFAQ